MLKIVVIIAGCLIVAVAVVLILAAMKPDTFTVSRSTAIKTSPEKIYPLIEDFRRWTAWSPYEHKDPNLQRNYGGAPSGKGATYAWEGNREIGAGHMEIIEAAAPSKVALKLDFSRPFEAHNTVTFTLVSQGDDTMVTWAMRGHAPLLARVISVFLNMDKMVGGDFEVGLANLKAAAEK